MLLVLLNALTLYYCVLNHRKIADLREEMPDQRELPAHQEEIEIPFTDSAFDERIRTITAELESYNSPATLYDLPHSAVKTTQKFIPEYAD